MLKTTRLTVICRQDINDLTCSCLTWSQPSVTSGFWRLTLPYACLSSISRSQWVSASIFFPPFCESSTAISLDDIVWHRETFLVPIWTNYNLLVFSACILFWCFRSSILPTHNQLPVTRLVSVVFSSQWTELEPLDPRRLLQLSFRYGSRRSDDIET